MTLYSVSPSLEGSHRDKVLFGDAAARGEEYVLIGRVAELGANRPVLFDISSERVVGIFGKRGSGKSYTLGSILEGLAVSTREETCLGKVSGRRGVLLFDTLNIFWTTGLPLFAASTDREVQAQNEAVDKWRLSNPGMNVVVWVPRGFKDPLWAEGYNEFSINVSSFSEEDWGALLQTNIYEDRMGQLLSEAYGKVTKLGWVKTDGSSVDPREDYAVNDLVTCLRMDQDIQASYQRETIRALVQRLQAYATNPLFTQGGTRLADLIRPGVLSVLLCNRLDDALRQVIAAVLFRQVLTERSRIAELTKRLRLDTTISAEVRKEIQAKISRGLPPTWMVVDEAQNLLPSERKVTSTDTIVKYVREGRNHGLSFMFTTQQPGAIDPRIMAQIDTLICHTLTVSSDVDAVERNLKAPHPSTVKLGNRSLDFSGWLRSLSRGQAIVSNVELDRNFVIEVRPRVSPHGGVEA